MGSPRRTMRFRDARINCVGIDGAKCTRGQEGQPARARVTSRDGRSRCTTCNSVLDKRHAKTGANA